MLPEFDTLYGAATRMPSAIDLGTSREGRAVAGYRFGRGPHKLSLIAGCHADEPVGPLLLRRLVGYLASLGSSHPLLTGYQWWIVPHINPDGAGRNAAWSSHTAGAFDLVSYLSHAVREAPGDDVEFGFPRDAGDRGARPENLAVYRWWVSQPPPFVFHASLHGMAFAGGPWFLIDPAWVGRSEPLRDDCRRESEALGYVLHDVERHGDKGFHRIERGFCTRPDSDSMARHFLERGDPETAAKFRPSSMETIRSLGGDPLTLVSEIPLFITPGVGDTVDPSDPVADTWRQRIGDWKATLDVAGEDARTTVAAQARASGVHAVPVVEQMRLQWCMVRSGISLVSR